ncbi:MAG: hypothetical protein ACHQQP_00305 [Gemmatimonadales bacterium]
MNESIQSPELDEETYGLRDIVRERQPDDPDPPRRPETSVKFYVALWLPVSGALLAYSVTRGSFWAAFVGIELLLVGLYTLAKL